MRKCLLMAAWALSHEPGACVADRLRQHRQQRLQQHGHCSTASNHARMNAGRAHVWFGYAPAQGSNQLMGRRNISSHYVIGSC